MMQTTEVAARIKAFPQWLYQFDLQGHLTPVVSPDFVNRQRERKRYCFDPILELLGGSLQGKRILDLGCNAGFWSLAAIEAGCEFVLGVDGREMHIDQSNFVFDINGVDTSRYQFDLGNIFDYDFESHQPFDVVLCFGLLYHVAKPFSLIERISRVNTDLLVIDTAISELPGSFLSLTQEAPLEGDPRRAVDYRLVAYPTKMAVRDIAREMGYEVAVLKPVPEDCEGMRDYVKGARRAFLCSKQTDLGGLSVPIEPISPVGQALDSARWLRNRVVGMVRSNAQRP
jgi:SAM-dependent methyltransferase